MCVYWSAKSNKFLGRFKKDFYALYGFKICYTFIRLDMAKKKTQPKTKPTKTRLLIEIEAIVNLLNINHFKGKNNEEIKKDTSTFYESGYWDFQKGIIQGRIFYDKMFMCESRIVVDKDFHKLNRHAQIFVSVPKNGEERKELLAALYDLQFVGDDFSFREYSKDVL